MAPYKSVMYQSWYPELHKKEFVYTEFNITAPVNVDHLNTAVLEWIV
jgi:hypothetical protein